MSQEPEGMPAQPDAQGAQEYAPPGAVPPAGGQGAPPAGQSPASGPVEPDRGGGRSAGIWIGAVLVLLGAALLIDQFVPGVSLWRFWPLIIIVLGLRGMFPDSKGRWTPKRLGDGLFGVAVGLVLLGQMLGILAWDVWLSILSLWPLLLVALGLEVLGKGLRTPWLGVIGSLILVSGIAFGALVMSPTQWSWPPVMWSVGSAESFSEREPRDADVTEGTARIDAGVGRFSLQGGRVLASAEGRLPHGVEFEASRSGSAADVRIGPKQGNWLPGTRDARMDVTLDSAVAWDLRVNAGVSDFTVDLTDIVVSGLDLNAGVSSGTLVLGDAMAAGTRESIEASIDSGVSALEIRVPSGQDVRITMTSGLLDLDVPGAWSKSRDGERAVYESPSFSDRGAYWDITIRAGIGSIRVEDSKEDS